MSSHEVPAFDALAGARSPFEGFGPVMRGRELEENLEEVVTQASRRISDVFGINVGADRAGVASLDNVIQQLWQTGWDPDRGDVNLFARDLGSILALALSRRLHGDLVFRSSTDLSHPSVWWPSAGIEAFPFHKTWKALLQGQEESLSTYYDGLKAKVTARDS